ncbi:MAG: ferritin-like protein [Xenococcaceae cyanobacterium MO_167.B52]|nr:ferritin-like protein [Xenococcaceae cyanobacterium MO_167.B52]
MTSSQENDLIQSVDDLHFYLKQAMMIEHATIPPYMTALYSIKPGSNIEAFQIIRSVAVEEMLHLVLAANVYNAVGGDIRNTLSSDEFIPKYPTTLPTGETDFKVGLGKFSPETIDTFLSIERSKEVDEGQPIVGPRPSQNNLLAVRDANPQYSFYSIGLFYAEIIRGLYALYQEMGDDLFCGDPQRQITPEYYYDGAGDIIKVTDLTSAIRALTMIQEQGEGSVIGTIYDAERLLSHYYRFDQLKRGQYYIVDQDNPSNSDQPNQPTGDTFAVDWDAVYPIKENPKLSDYSGEPELHSAAQEFQSAYSDFLAKIEYAFDGHPETLLPAVGGMFKLKYQAERLIKNPIPGRDGMNAAPIYRLD